jgi:cytochrome c oxidase subunit 1
MRREPEVVVTGLSTARREVLVTEIMDAEPLHCEDVPQPTIWSFFTVVAVTALFIGTMYTGWALVYGAIPLAFTGTMWFRSELKWHKEPPTVLQPAPEPQS